MHLKQITTLAELEALRPAWDRLWEECPSATPFQSPDWLIPWWRHLGRGSLWVLALYEGGELSGLAPLFRHRYFGLPLRGVSLLGTGNSDYLDWLVRPGVLPQPFWECLEAHRKEWDFCDFQQVPAGSSLLGHPFNPAAFVRMDGWSGVPHGGTGTGPEPGGDEPARMGAFRPTSGGEQEVIRLPGAVLSAATPRGQGLTTGARTISEPSDVRTGEAASAGEYGSRVLAQEVCPVLSLGASPGEAQASVPGKMRSNLRYYRRKAERLGVLRMETAGPDQVLPLLTEMFRLHGARWRRRGLPGVFGSRRVRAFHTEAAVAFQRRGWLHLHGLYLREAVHGALYCFVCRRRGYYYGGGFDPELSHASPGTLLIGFAIEAAAARGAVEFDFLRGNEPYKYLWGATDRINHRVLLWRETGPGRLFPLLNQVERTAERAVKQAVRRRPRR